MEKEKAVVSEMLNNYYSQTYRHCERNKGFIEVSTVSGERMFVSVHHIAYVKATKFGLGVIVDRNGKSITTDKHTRYAGRAIGRPSSSSSTRRKPSLRLRARNPIWR